MTETPGQHPESQGSNPTLSPNYVVEKSVNTLAKMCFFVLLLAWTLTMTSSHLWLNLPVALLCVVGARWLSLQVEVRYKGSEATTCKQRRRQQQSGEDFAAAPVVPPLPAAKPEGRWREQVKAPVVEHAWEVLCGSIVQEFLYDAWWAGLTPDREFPADVRRILNTAFGELAGRARRVDVRGMLIRDVSDVLIEQLDLFRDTRDGILAGVGRPAFADMSLPARDRALKQELKADNNLHPALCTPDGHYKVLRTVAEGLAAFLLERADFSKVMLRVVAREMLSSCVLRSIMFLFTPYTINKMLLEALMVREQRKLTPREERELRQLAAATKGSHKKGHWEFEQRLMESAELEDSAVSAQRAAKRDLRQRLRTTKAPDRQPPDSAQVHAHVSFADEQSRSAAASAASTRIAASRQAHTPVAEGGALQSQRGSDESDGWESVPAPPQAHVSGAALLADTVAQAMAEGHLADDGRLSPPRRLSQQQLVPRHANEERVGFKGKPRAKVVAADLHSEGSKDYVVYKIRVADSSGEWTVSRRFRNFETLHRQLRELPQYRLKLPPKRIFFHSQSVDFVEERREQLDQYLHAVLAEPAFAGTEDVWEFCSAWSEAYALEEETGVLRALGASMTSAKTSVRRAVGDALEEMDRKGKASFAALQDLPGPRTLAKGLSSLGRHDTSPIRGSRGVSRAESTPAPMSSAFSGTQSGVGGSGRQLLPGAMGSRSCSHHTASTSARSFSSSQHMGRSVSGKQLLDGGKNLLSRAGQAANGAQNLITKAGQAAKRAGSSSSMSRPRSNPNMARAASDAISSVDGEAVMHSSRDDAHLAPPAGSSEEAESPGRQRPAFAGLQRAQAGPHPVPDADAAADSEADSSGTGPNQLLRGRRASSDTAAGTSSPDITPIAAAAAAELRCRSAAASAATASVTAPAGAGAGEDVGHLDFGMIVAQSTPSATAAQASNIHAVDSSALKPAASGKVEDEGGGGVAGLDVEEAAGISAPLYEVLDVTFRLASRGFFRRQVFTMARQVLSLVAGEAIDVYLVSQLKLLRQEHTLARLIHSLQTMLWPGGKWFMWLPKNLPPADAPKPTEPWKMRAERFLETDAAPPIDEEEIREALHALLMTRAPPALVRIIGKDCYQSGVQDLFDMLQSKTFVQQVGYELLEIAVVNLFPELKPLFRQMERGAL